MAQDIPFCGPEKETCVANVTLKDKACLISCDGLYADIEDISLKQSVMEGLYILLHFLKLPLQGVFLTGPPPEVLAGKISKKPQESQTGPPS